MVLSCIPELAADNVCWERHSIRRAALRAATTHVSRAVVATPRLAWAPKATSSNLLLSSATVLSRSFVATRWLANQVDSADQGEGINEYRAPAEASESGATSAGEGKSELHPPPRCLCLQAI